MHERREEAVDSVALGISQRLVPIAWTTLQVAHTLHSSITALFTLFSQEFNSSLLNFKFIKNGSLLIFK
jgi:hypothetical protein